MLSEKRHANCGSLHTDFITAQLKDPEEMAGYLEPHGHVSVEMLFVRHLAVTEEANKLRFLATLTLSAHLARVGQVACVSWPCVCGKAACTMHCSHRRGTDSVFPCHTDSITKTPYSHTRGKQTVVPCDTDSFAVQNKGPSRGCPSSLFLMAMCVRRRC